MTEITGMEVGAILRKHLEEAGSDLTATNLDVSLVASAAQRCRSATLTVTGASFTDNRAIRVQAFDCAATLEGGGGRPALPRRRLALRFRRRRISAHEQVRALDGTRSSLKRLRDDLGSEARAPRRQSASALIRPSPPSARRTRGPASAARAPLR